MQIDRASGVQSVHAGGIEIAYRLDGPAAAPVLMLANGLLADMGLWDDNVPALVARWRVLRYDMRGHGGSSAPPGPASVAQLALDAGALLDHLGLDRVHFVGISLGGMVGQQLGIEHADRLLSLVLCNTGSTLAPAARRAWDERIAASATDFNGVIEATLARWFTGGFAQRQPALHARTRTMLQRTGAAGYATCAAAVRDVELAAQLGRISVPTLVLHGREDVAWSTAQAQELARAIAGSRLAFIDDAGHMPCIEQPQAFNRALGEFLAAQTRSS